MRVFLIIIGILVQGRQIVFNRTSTGFPKVIWQYWDQGVDSVQFFTKLCLQNKQNYAKASGWKHIVVSNATLGDYLDPAEVDRYFSIAPSHHIQLKADIIRLLLVKNYGGLYVDINTYFLNDLSWTENFNLPHIQNKFGKSPDIFLGAYTDSAYQYYRKLESGQVVNVLPLYENWFIMSKPHAEFLEDWLKVYVETCEKTKEKMDEEIIKAGIILHPTINIHYFIGSDYPEQIVIQRKQKELQRENSTQFAVEYYKIWHFEGFPTAFKVFFDADFFRLPMWADLSVYGSTVINRYASLPPFLRKFMGYQPSFMSHFLQNYVVYNCWGLQFLVQDESQVSQVHFSASKGMPIMKQIEEIHQDLGSKDYCQHYIEKNASGIQVYIDVAFWSVLFLMALIAYCCYHFCSQNMAQIKKMDKKEKDYDKLASSQVV